MPTLSSAKVDLKPESLEKPLPPRALEWDDLPSYSNVLLLQGPVGPFFSNLRKYWVKRGAVVSKVNFNPGDDFFYPPKTPETLQYTHRIEYWSSFIFNYLTEKRIDAVILFGDHRPMHAPIKNLCKILGIDLYSLEEGYIRPNYYTLEKGRVNAYSHVSNLDLNEIKQRATREIELSQSGKIGYKSFNHMMRWAFLYWGANILRPLAYPNYDHHRELNLKQAKKWFKSFFRYWKYQLTENSQKRSIREALENQSNCFLMPLQVHDDTQVTVHSDYDSIETMIEEVITSFSRHLENGQYLQTPKLVIKHHPMDRGHKDYKGFISGLASTLNIDEHVIYVHDLNLDEAFALFKGCITINSTIGLQALNCGVPVINLGRSFYDKKGLTDQKNLDQFWESQDICAKGDVLTFRNYLIQSTQVNGCLYDPKHKL